MYRPSYKRLAVERERLIQLTIPLLQAVSAPRRYCETALYLGEWRLHQPLSKMLIIYSITLRPVIGIHIAALSQFYPLLPFRNKLAEVKWVTIANHLTGMTLMTPTPRNLLSGCPVSLSWRSAEHPKNLKVVHEQLERV